MNDSSSEPHGRKSRETTKLSLISCQTRIYIYTYTEMSYSGDMAYPLLTRIIV